MLLVVDTDFRSFVAGAGVLGVVVIVVVEPSRHVEALDGGVEENVLGEAVHK